MVRLCPFYVFVLKEFKPEGGMQRLVKVFLYCGISTAFWGVMFGSMFGDAIPAAAKLLFILISQ